MPGGALNRHFRAKHMTNQEQQKEEEEEKNKKEEKGSRHNEHSPPPHGSSHWTHAARSVMSAASRNPEHEQRLAAIEARQHEEERRRSEKPEGSGAMEHNSDGAEVTLVVPLQGFRLLGTSNNLIRVRATHPEIEHFLLNGAQTVAAPAVGSTQTTPTGVIPSTVVIPPPGVGITKYAGIHVWANTGILYGGVISINLSWYVEFNNTQQSFTVTGVVSGAAGSVTEFLVFPWFLNGVEPRLGLLRVGALPSNGLPASVTNPTNTPAAEIYANALGAGVPPANLALDGPDNGSLPFTFSGQGIASQQVGVNLLSASNPLVRSLLTSEHKASRWHSMQASP